MNDAPDKHSGTSPQGWAIGLAVVAVGVYFLLRNLGVDLPFVYMHNWWALFIFVAALGPLTQAVRAWRARGRVDAIVARHALSALVIVTLGLMLLVDVRWDRWWPVFMIYGGLWMMVRERR